MGCCGSIPTAEEFLAMAQPECPDPLLPDMPRAMLMNPWKAPSTLSLTSPEGAPLASIAMPPRRSFGMGATVTDAQGKPVAWLRSPEPHRQHGISSSRYNIYAAKPQVQGQQPVVVDTLGTTGYLWATVTRRPFTNQHTVTNSTGTSMFTGRHRMMFDADCMQTYMAERNGAGICHISKRKTKQPPVHDIQVAQGVDALLCVLVKLAAELANDELEKSNGGGGGDCP